MKKIIQQACLFLLLVIAAGCGSPEVEHKLAIADSVIEENPDSANAILSDILFSDISNDADKALFMLLDNQSKYKLERKASSADLDFCIDYYTRHHNPVLLQRCYYYRAVINEENEAEPSVVIKDYKEAEKLINESGNDLMATRICEALYLVNVNSFNFDDALEYAKEELKYSIAIRDTSFIVQSLNNSAISMLQNMKKDSAMFYIHKTFSMLEKCDSTTKAMIYSNLANFYWDYLSDSIMAENFYEKAMMYNPREEFILSQILLFNETGKIRKVMSLIDSLIISDDAEMRVAALDFLCKLHISNKDYKAALEARERCDELLDSIDIYANEENIKEIQRKYDFERERTEKKQTQLKFYIILLIIISVSLAVFVGILVILRKKEHRIRMLEQKMKELDKCIERIKCDGEISNKEKVAEFMQIIKRKQQIISELDRKINKVSTEGKIYRTLLNNLSDGLHSLYYVLQGEKNVLTEKQERENFVKCYALLDEAFIQNVDKISSLTLSDKVYCVLYRMNLSAESIQYALGISNEAYRKAKSRLVKKLKTEPSMRCFCDNIGEK